MADEIGYITFDNDELQSTEVTINGVVTPSQTVYLNGTVEVDYTNKKVTTLDAVGTTYQPLTVTGDGIATHGYGGSVNLNTTSGGLYQFSFGGTAFNPGLEISYETKTPTQASNIAFNSDPGNTDNTEYFSDGADTVTTSATPPAPPPCFATGTAITTARGPIAVEHLVVGDMALTMSGTYSRVGWIGHCTLDCRRHVRPPEVMPIRIAAHAFAANAPARDLVLSPGHAICVRVCGEVLIPAGALVNGANVTRLNVESVTYWHVELEKHDILLAENLPCESYLDMGNRGFFAESDTITLAAMPDTLGRTHANFCRPFHGSGAIVDAARRRLDARAMSSQNDRTVRVA